MKNQIIQRLLGTLLSTVLIMSIVACSLRFIPNNRPPEPRRTLVEAPIVRTIRIVVAWFKGGGGDKRKGSSKSPFPEPQKPK